MLRARRQRTQPLPPEIFCPPGTNRAWDWSAPDRERSDAHPLQARAQEHDLRSERLVFLDDFEIGVTQVERAESLTSG